MSDGYLWDRQHTFSSTGTHLTSDHQCETETRRPSAIGDIQGIHFDTLQRTGQRRERIFRYDTIGVLEGMKRAITPNDKVQATLDDCNFFHFRQNCRVPACSLAHFQLRHCIKAISGTDVFHAQSDSSVFHWNTAAYDTEHGRRGLHTKVLDFPSANSIISTLSALDHVVAAGCIHGELAVKNLHTGAMLFNEKVTSHPNAINNYIDLVDQYGGPRSTLRAGNLLRCILSQNDSVLREFHISTSRMQLVQEFRLPWSINHATLDPTGKMICASGDDDNVLLIDADSGKKIATLRGHMDHVFSTSWNPVATHYVATGAQDRTCRIWDTRMLIGSGHTGSWRSGVSSDDVLALKGCISAMRCVRYSSDGQLLCASEAADFVHIYSVQDGYTREQMLDVFGEIVGIDLSPDGSALFVGVFDAQLKSIIEFGAVQRCSVEHVLV